MLVVLPSPLHQPLYRAFGGSVINDPEIICSYRALDRSLGKEVLVRGSSEGVDLPCVSDTK